MYLWIMLEEKVQREENNGEMVKIELHLVMEIVSIVTNVWWFVQPELTLETELS